MEWVVPSGPILATHVVITDCCMCADSVDSGVRHRTNSRHPTDGRTKAYSLCRRVQTTHTTHTLGHSMIQRLIPSQIQATPSSEGNGTKWVVAMNDKGQRSSKSSSWLVLQHERADPFQAKVIPAGTMVEATIDSIRRPMNKKQYCTHTATGT